MVEVTLLLAHSFDFLDANRFKRSTAKRVEDSLDEERLHNGDDLFHEKLSVVSSQLGVDYYFN
jgi:hypothetical protein